MTADPKEFVTRYFPITRDVWKDTGSEETQTAAGIIGSLGTSQA
jgi:hypothetical protein